MNHHSMRRAVAPLLIGLIVLTACNRQDTAPPAADASQPNPSLMDDAALTARVKTALAKEAGLGTISLNVDSDKGVVTIFGKVPDSAMREAVIRVASGVEGVSLVNNQIVIGQ